MTAALLAFQTPVIGKTEAEIVDQFGLPSSIKNDPSAGNDRHVSRVYTHGYPGRSDGVRCDIFFQGGVVRKLIVANGIFDN